jgi:hypothetical protein
MSGPTYCVVKIEAVYGHLLISALYLGNLIVGAAAALNSVP